MRKSRILLVMAAFFTVIAGAAFLFTIEARRADESSATAAAALFSHLPTGAPTLIYIDLAAIRGSRFYRNRPDHAPITVPDKNYASFIAGTGFDFEKDLDRVAVAFWPRSASQPQQSTVVVAEGRFNRQKIREYATRNGKLSTEQGHEVFLFPAQNSTAANAVVFLDPQRIALVQGLSVAAVLATHLQDGSDPVRQRAARMAGTAALAISRVPEIPENASLGGAQSAQLANLARSIQWITLAANPVGENMRISLDGECKTGADARQLQGALGVLRLFAQAGLADPKTRGRKDTATFEALNALLKSVDVTSSAERVRILIELTPDILKLSGRQKTAGGVQ